MSEKTARLDSLDMASAVVGLPEQWRLDDSTQDFDALGALAPKAVVVVGDSVARRAGSAARAVLGKDLLVPLVAVRFGALPAFVGPTTLAVVVAGGPDDAAALEAVAEASVRQAAVAALSFGAPLAADVAASAVLTEVPRRRVGLFSVLAHLLFVLSSSGLAADTAAARRAAAEQTRVRLSAPLPSGWVAYEPYSVLLARRIGRTFPYVVGASGIGAVAAQCWRAAVTANAKTPAFSASVPELFDDEIAAFGQAGDVTRQVATLVTLRSEFEPPEAAELFARLDDLLAEIFSDVLAVRAKGSVPLACFADLVALGEVVSLELAAAAGVDPGPAPAIDEGAGLGGET